ncbi:MAG: ABC transporter ATP-binding protein [bacterium]|nr:ABC transporter ATP-binding protein [bacterium]MCP5068441.1 ABC transporter ATP-binding protein [bacterium]
MSAPKGAGLNAILEEESLGKAVDRALLGRLWAWVEPYKGKVALTILMVVPMFPLELAPAWIVKTGIDRVMLGEGSDGGNPLDALLTAPEGWAPLVWLACLFLVVSVTSSILTYAHMLLMVATGQAAMRDLRREVFDHIQSLHLGFFDTYPVGRLVTRATSDVEHVAEMFSQGLVALVTDIFKMVGFASVLFIVNPKLALWTFAVVPFLVIAAVVFRLKVREAFRSTRVLLARINATIQETVTGMKVVQLFSREARNLRDFEDLNGAHRDAWHKSIWYDSALFSVVELASGITVAVVIWGATGWATAGVIYLFINYMRRFFMPLRDLSAKYSVMQSSMASIERILQLLDTQPAIRDPEPGWERHVAGGEAPPARGEIEFDHVWFAYSAGDDEEDWVLKDISFKVAPGEKVAFVGATGAGKTTVINLLTRLYEVSRGRILLDGVDLREIPQAELRRRVGMVLQDVFLFSGSVAENLALGREDLGREVIRTAATAVEADRFIMTLPDGYETEVRERGTNFSTGQRQLLSFARALAHGADVLVLDEATSSIDTETEAMVQRGIHVLMEGKTSLVIAHRLSTIEDVDRIYVLHHGELAESGSHADLLEQDGLYAQLRRLQQTSSTLAHAAVSASSTTG